jgi:phosphatidate cytidylyltransferase
MLRQRVITALILAPLALLVILWVPHEVSAAAMALLVLAAAWEWSAFVGLTRASLRFAYVALIALCVAAIWATQANRELVNAVLSVSLLWWLLALLWVVVFAGRINSVAAIVAGALVLVPAWLALVQLHARAPQLVLLLILLVVAADVGAYFGGRRFGRHKLAPTVSPGKTWEGVAGGLVAALSMAAVGIYWFNLSALPFLALTAVVVFASIVGDLTESMFKRHAGLKDSGSLLPGHGGVLDRVDSVTAAAPFFLIGLERLGLLQ